MENYEQKHKEDLEEAKGWLAIAKENNDKIAIQILEKFFPELKESEDERIRKDLIKYLNTDMNENPSQSDSFYNKCIAWLEKQGEQKHGWSEEDEDAVDIAIRIIQNKGDDCAGILDSDKALNWLKSFKDRYTWKPSEEQIEMLENIRKILHNKAIYSKSVHLMYAFEELIRTLNKLKA